MIRKFKQKNITWLDIKSPNQTNITQLTKDYNLHPAVAEELLTPSQKSHIDSYEKYIFLVLHFPTPANQKDESTKTNTQELNIILGQDYIITVRYQTIIPIEEFGNIFSGQIKTINKDENLQAGFLFYRIIKEMHKTLAQEVASIINHLKPLERKVTDGEHENAQAILIKINERLSDLEPKFKTHKETLHPLESILISFFNKDFTPYIRSIKKDLDKIHTAIKSSGQTLTKIEQKNNTLLLIKKNKRIKKIVGLTIAILGFLIIALVVILAYWLF